MAQLQGTDIADLVTTTLNELGENKFTDLMSDYQNTIALKRLIKKNKMSFDAGPQVEFRIITDDNQSARFVGLGAVDIVDIPNVMTKGVVDWRHITWNWAIERRMIAMNRSPRKIVDITKIERITALGSAIKKFENAFWRVPAVTDLVTAYGIPYYVVKSNTAAIAANNDGFNGLVPSGYTLVANLNPSTAANNRWRNYATQYTTVSKDDLIRKWRRMAMYTEFTPLVDDMPVYNLGDDYGHYTNYSVYGTCVEILESQNENLGDDIAPMEGKLKFKRGNVVFVKELDLDTTNPVYSLNWGELFTMGLRGEWMNETTIPIVPGQHTVTATHTDCTFNLLCRNRRRQGVLATNTTMGY